MTEPDSTQRTRSVRDDAAAALTSTDLVVEDVTITPAGKRRLVRIVVDVDMPNLDGETTDAVEPVSLDTVAEATRLISQALDASEAMGQAPYVLEVSSPGTDRPLREARQFRRNVGRKLSLSLEDGTSLVGRLVAAGDQAIRLIAIEGGDAEPERSVRYEQIASARVEVEFNRPEPDVARPGEADEAGGTTTAEASDDIDDTDELDEQDQR